MISKIIRYQKTELSKRLKEKYIKRESSINNLHNNLIKVIIGPRRAGKSFFAMHSLKESGNFGYVNFDDEKLIKINNYDDIIDAVTEVYGDTKLILFDEIQNLPKWELFLNRLQRQGYNLVITGSNSNLLSGELATHLTGRYSLTNIFPFSFREVLRLYEKPISENLMKNYFNSYLLNGGYPEIYIKNPDLKDYYNLLFDNIILKDIYIRYKLRKIDTLNSLSQFLISNIAEKYSYNTLSDVSEIGSVHTVKKYIYYFSETYIFNIVNQFSFKVKETIKSQKKIYCIDNGFINTKSMSVSPDYGKLLENLVAVQLSRKSAENNQKIYYWQNPQSIESDFVVTKNKKIDSIIQVCYDLSNPKTRKRKLRGLEKCYESLKCQNLLLITSDEEGEEIMQVKNKKVKVKIVPAWKWFCK